MVMQDFLEMSSSSVSVLQFLCSLGINVSVIFLTSRNILWVIALKGFDIEDISKRTSIGSGNSFDTDIELSTVGWVSMTSVMSRLVYF